VQNTQKTEEAIRQAESAIRAVVGKLIKSSSVREADYDDIAQILRLHVAQKAADHDPERSGLKTFIERIVANKVRDILEGDRAACRDTRKVSHSMDEPAESLDGEDRTFADTVDAVGALRRAGLLPWAADDALVIDVQNVLTELSELDRLTCDVLGATKSLREAAQNLGIHVETLRSRLVRIRSEFQSRGITGV
jgi:RNA polymerase sigma factor (sigma-70 family)